MIDLLLVCEQMVSVLHKILAAGSVMENTSVSLAAESCKSKAQRLCNAYRRRLRISDAASGAD